MNRDNHDRNYPERGRRRVADRSYLNDDYSRYAGPDYREDNQQNYGPYDVNRSFDNGEFRFDEEEFGHEKNFNRRRQSDWEHPGVSGKSRRGEAWTNRNERQDQRRYAERNFRGDPRQLESMNYNDRPDGYGFGPSESEDNDQPYERDRRIRPGVTEDEYGMRNQYGPVDQYTFRDQYVRDWSHDTRSEASSEKKSFRGKGPKGYKRSDERIRDEACEALYRDWEIDASNVEVTVEEGIVTLKGSVNSRHEKRLAEDLCENLSGVEDVRNEIRVKKGIEGWVPGIGKTVTSAESNEGKEELKKSLS